MKKLIFAVLAGAMLLVPSELRAWGQEGHRIIAEVAYHYLSSGARNKIDKVLGKHGMVYAANWPDEIKSDTIYPQSHKQGWHYQDLNGGMSDSAVVAALTDYPKEGGSLFRVTDSLRTLLKQEPTNHDALVFLIHIAGDRYCPMHMGHLDDAGGNRVKMKWFGSNTNLHTVWDSKLIDSQGYSYTEYTQFLIDKYDSTRKDLLKKSEAEMVLENYHVTTEIYEYQKTFDGNTYHYIYKFHQPMEWQLYKAGVRLALWLSEIY
ncbi:MAG: S1/P1 nuclease [Paludibacteraceae bacterium]|nr:S1/P1 nuclease [Paludibacteraceae bacterium]